MNERRGGLIIGLLVLGGIIYAFSGKDNDTSTPDPSYTSASDSGSSSSDSEFHGYDCTQDCSGHEAGYRWAEEHDLTDEDDCDGKSESFIEGCKAYVQEQAHDEDTEGEPRDDDD